MLYVSEHRLERLDRLADKVQHDCRTAEGLLDDVERKLNEVVYTRGAPIIGRLSVSADYRPVCRKYRPFDNRQIS